MFRNKFQIQATLTFQKTTLLLMCFTVVKWLTSGINSGIVGNLWGSYVYYCSVVVDLWDTCVGYCVVVVNFWLTTTPQ